MKFPTMGVFYQEEPQNQTKRCKYLAAILKEAFSHCQASGRKLSSASFEEEGLISDLDEEQEVVVSAVRSKAIEKQKHKENLLREIMRVTKTTEPPQEREGDDEEHDEREQEFLSVKSCFSCSSPSSAVMSDEAFYSVKTNLSRCPSSMNTNEVVVAADLSEYYWRSSIIQELCRHCEGWPFGLCRRAVLLPPLPKSPSESWLSRKIMQRGSKEN